MEYLDQLEEFQKEIFNKQRNQVIQRRKHLELSQRFDITKINQLPEDIEWYIQQFLGKELMEMVRKSSILHRYCDNIPKYYSLPKQVKINMIQKYRIFPGWFNKGDYRSMTIKTTNDTLDGELHYDVHTVCNMELIQSKKQYIDTQYWLIRELEIYWRYYDSKMKKKSKSKSR
jgi:phage gp36-like protein